MSQLAPSAGEFDRILLLLAARTGCSFEGVRRTSAEIGIGRAMARGGSADADTYYTRLVQDRDALDDLIDALMAEHQTELLAAMADETFAAQA